LNHRRVRRAGVVPALPRHRARRDRVAEVGPGGFDSARL